MTSEGLRAPKTAAVLVIGNELLSGKVEEANVGALARVLRGLGIQLRRVVMVLDDVDVIAHDVKELSRAHDWLFTSGGVGPTHDDVTVEAVARAFGVPVVVAPEMEKMLREHYRERCTPGHLRMALIPQGAALETTNEIRWPTVRIANTWVMPGIPEVFRMKLPVIAHRIAEGAAPYISRAVYTTMDEGDLRPLLDEVVARFPDIDVGSYPKWMDASYKTKLTFDGRDDRRVEEARDALVALIPPKEVVRSE